MLIRRRSSLAKHLRNGAGVAHDLELNLPKEHVRLMAPRIFYPPLIRRLPKETLARHRKEGRIKTWMRGNTEKRIGLMAPNFFASRQNVVWCTLAGNGVQGAHRAPQERTLRCTECNLLCWIQCWILPSVHTPIKTKTA
ncbi:unnamed protein product [Ectocarpus fasciculatus]